MHPSNPAKPIHINHNRMPLHTNLLTVTPPFYPFGLGVTVSESGRARNQADRCCGLLSESATAATTSRAWASVIPGHIGRAKHCSVACSHIGKVCHRERSSQTLCRYSGTG